MIGPGMKPFLGSVSAAAGLRCPAVEASVVTLRVARPRVVVVTDHRPAPRLDCMESRLPVFYYSRVKLDTESRASARNTESILKLSCNSRDCCKRATVAASVDRHIPRVCNIDGVERRRRDVRERACTCAACDAPAEVKCVRARESWRCVLGRVE